jgi:hypothetical protein
MIFFPIKRTDAYLRRLFQTSFPQVLIRKLRKSFHLLLCLLFLIHLLRISYEFQVQIKEILLNNSKDLFSSFEAKLRLENAGMRYRLTQHLELRNRAASAVHSAQNERAV